LRCNDTSGKTDAAAQHDIRAGDHCAHAYSRQAARFVISADRVDGFAIDGTGKNESEHKKESNKKHP